MIDKGQKKGCRIASFVYRSKSDQSLCQFTVLLGVSMERAYRRDLAILKALGKQDSRDREAARRELMTSIEESLNQWKRGKQNQNYVLKDLYEDFNQGIKMRLIKESVMKNPKNPEVSAILFVGYVIGRKVLEPGIPRKPVNSSRKTIEKQKLSRLLKRGRIRSFCIENEELYLVSFGGKKIAL